jgi:protoporphyrinogen oxidase
MSQAESGVPADVGASANADSDAPARVDAGASADRRPHIGIVGAGILGTVLALRLAQGGARVTLLERAPTPGGLAGAIDFGGHRVDRFYHVIVPSDQRMIGLVEELGLSKDLSFSPVGVGFFVDGKMYPFNGIGDFLRFPPLSVLGRARLAWFVLHCQLRRNYRALERKPLERWLTRHCGRAVVQRIWRPLLDSRFNSHHGELPATYLWARTNRMRSARDKGSSGETMGCLRGGHEALVLAVAKRASELGVDVRLGAGVEGLIHEDGAIAGVRVDGRDERFDLTIPTLQPPGLRHLLPSELQPLLTAYPERYLGVVCLILKLRRSLLPYYSVNICDPTPITTVVETSHVVGSEHTDGLRLAYLPKYCDPTAPEFSEDDQSIYERFTEMLKRLVPDFSDEDVVDWTVQRAPLVEPVHALGHEPRTAPIWPGVEGLALASASQIYPRLLNGESVVGLAERVAAEALERTGALGATDERSTSAQAAAA